ncbi:helix-hairpin-helix domain-containing protein [Cytobacillus sp. Hz8]|uniref:helix-hairpin-helix domain-containing protein n=1 Tax=Cytobacillus sp. Hz8 TaxID=3347168 RepID=UPI0035E29C90
MKVGVIMFEWIKAHKKLSLIFSLLILAAICFSIPFVSLNQKETNKETEWNDLQQSLTSDTLEKQETKQTVQKQTEKMEIIVDVKGAVNKPGVYEAKDGERVKDIINKAGGLKGKADEKNINFAERVKDEMVVYIPEVGEVPKDMAMANGANEMQNGEENKKVNLNSADETELQTLPGIGPSKAAAIIEYRETNGSFKAIEDLKSISGIGDKTFEKLQESISVN